MSFLTRMGAERSRVEQTFQSRAAAPALAAGENVYKHSSRSWQPSLGKCYVLSKHYLIASVEAEDTQSSSEPLTQSKINFILFFFYIYVLWRRNMKIFQKISLFVEKTLTCICLNQFVSLQLAKQFQQIKAARKQKIIKATAWKQCLSFSHVEIRIMFWNSYKCISERNFLPSPTPKVKYFLWD